MLAIANRFLFRLFSRPGVMQKVLGEVIFRTIPKPLGVLFAYKSMRGRRGRGGRRRRLYRHVNAEGMGPFLTTAGPEILGLPLRQKMGYLDFPGVSNEIFGLRTASENEISVPGRLSPSSFLASSSCDAFRPSTVNRRNWQVSEEDV